VARTLGNLGILAREQGDLAGAKALQERALRIKEKAYGPEHPAVASTLGNLGLLAQDQGDLAGARALQERALRIEEKAYGPDHPAVARTLGNLGWVTLEQGDPAEARQLYERALGIKERVCGPGHPEVAITLTDLGKLLARVGEPEQVAPLVERALSIFRERLGAKHPRTMDARGQLREVRKKIPVGGDMIKVLFLAANPAGTTQLALDEEIRAIDAKIRGSEHPERLTLVSHWAVRLDDLSGLLMRQRPHVVHFSGHGASTGEIVLLREGGTPKPVPPEALAELFRVLKDNVRVVVLNACYSQAQAKAIVREIDCAVGMSDAIPDDAAIAFAAEFYQALGFGKSVQEAFDLGVARLIGEGVARGLAKLHKRRGVKPAGVVLIGSTPGPNPEAGPGPEVEGRAMIQAAGETPAPTVGIITALPDETAAVRAVLGDPPRIDVPGSGAGRAYWMAKVASPLGGIHHVVIAQADMGNNIAAVRASLLLSHFPTVESIIMCGIAGGIPSPGRPADHVRLGDVVVSNQKGVVQYDFVKRTVKRKRTDVPEEVRASPHRPSAVLLEAVRILESNKPFGQYPWEGPLQEGLARLKWVRPDPSTDVLADPSDGTKTLRHPDDEERRPAQPRVFLGPIASANTLLKDPAKRDALRDRFGAKAVEMEGSGILDATWTHGVGYLVVRGVCDYCDPNKNDVWQRYAAMAAAAYVRALLEAMPGAVPAHPQ
jgi:nucleoside phosphorylase/tetratricopeptide (TPR) repeat protein